MIRFVKNCRLYSQLKQTVHIAVNDGRIESIEYILPDSADVLFDAENMIVAPGLIDTHVHGCSGANPIDSCQKSLSRMANGLCRLGTTSFYATTFYSSKKKNTHLSMISSYKTQDISADCLGIHLEGPFISSKRRGGIPLDCTSSFTHTAVEDILELTGGRLKIMTLAPELQNSQVLISRLKEAGVITSFGHTDANFAETQKGMNAGVNMVTHIANAMRPFHHRDPGPLPAILNSSAFVQIISDGVHLHPQTVKFIYDIFGSQRCICITDGIESTGLPDGEYRFQGKPYLSEAGKAFYKEDGGLIGTSLALYDIMMRFKSFTGCSLKDAVDSASLNPAQAMGISDHKGKVRSGYKADLIFIDQDEKLSAVMKNGRMV